MRNNSATDSVKLQNLRFFFGANQFACMRELMRWKQAFLEKHGEFNVEMLDGKHEYASRIIQCCDTQPFMGEKRLVIVRDFLREGKAESAKNRDEEELDEAEVEARLRTDDDVLISYFDHLPDSCVLLFVSMSPDKRSKLFKTLFQRAVVHEFPEVSGISFIQWVQEEVRRLGGSMEPKALSYFTLHTGGDMWVAASELSKLVLYTNKPITVADIDIVASSNVQVKIFAFVDALGYKHITKALTLFHQLIDRGENIFMVWNMIIRQFRLLLEIRSLLDNNADNKTVASRLRLAPFQVTTLVQQARNFTFEQLKGIYRDLLKLDIDLKTGRIPSTGERQELFVLALERFFVKHGFSVR